MTINIVHHREMRQEHMRCGKFITRRGLQQPWDKSQGNTALWGIKLVLSLVYGEGCGYTFDPLGADIIPSRSHKTD
jgi:hypothetical protein